MTDGERGERNSPNHAQLRRLPAIDKLLRNPATATMIDQYGHDLVRDALRIALDAAREWIGTGGGAPSAGALLNAAETWLRNHHTPSLRPVINATGVIIHTNLGRAPLADFAQEAMIAVAAGYSTLEYELEAGKRGKRDVHAEQVVMAVTGAEAALVVNNNAAAVMLILAELAKDREVIISRGQLVEIGGGFRMPDVMARSGAKLVEIGTTNRTRIEDYEAAITPQAALLLRVHASNFKQIGFTAQPDLESMAKVAHKQNILAVDDLGSGALLDTASFGLQHEPTVQESLQAGFDLVAFSGDKLLGGPQAGIIVGREPLITRLKKHPLARAFRIDKLCLAGLVATLELYHRHEATKAIPVWRMISMSKRVIRERAEAWATEIASLAEVEVVEAQSAIGGGSLPGETLPTLALALKVGGRADEILGRLRQANTPVIARIANNQVLLDPRTVLPGQDEALVNALKSILSA